MGREAITGFEDLSKVVQHYVSGKNKGSEHRERDVEIIRLINEGKTYQEVGDMFGIVRERCRQIYVKYMGFSPVKLRQSIHDQKSKKYNLETKFICLACGKKINRLKGRGRNTFCKECLPPSAPGVDRKRVTLTYEVECAGCGKKFTPTRDQFIRSLPGQDVRYKSGSLYHNRACYNRRSAQKMLEVMAKKSDKI